MSEESAEEANDPSDVTAGPPAPMDGEPSSGSGAAESSDPETARVPEPPASARKRVVQVSLARDERPAISVDGDQPTVIDSYVDDSGRIMFELFNNDGVVEAKPLQEILSTAAATHRVVSPDVAPDPDAEILHWLSPELRAEALRIQAHIIDVRDGRPSGDTSKDAHLYDAGSTELSERRKAKMAELGWHASTLSRRERAYKKRDIVGLIPYSERKAQVKNVIDVPPEILAVIREHCQNRHLSSKKDLQTDYGIVIADLRRRGMVSRTPGIPSPDGGELPEVSEVLPYHRFVALLRQLDGGRTKRHAKTRHEQSKRPMGGPLRHRGYDFAEMLEVDSTQADFFVRGPDGESRSVYAVFAVCVSTKMMWLRLLDEPPRGRDLALLLFDILGGHSLARTEEYAQLSTVPTRLRVNAWPPNAGPPPGVLPTAIRLDHGAEEENQLWIGLSEQVPFLLLWAAIMAPSDKAYIESFISTFARDCQLVPGHKGNTVLNRPQFIHPSALPTFEQVTRAFSHWQAWAAQP